MTDFGRCKHFFAGNGNTTLTVPILKWGVHNLTPETNHLLNQPKLDQVSEQPICLVYPHNVYKQRPYDGFLVSKAYVDSCVGLHKRNRKTIRKTLRLALRECLIPVKREKQIWRAYKRYKKPTMHNILLAPPDLPIMGDCGAFSFVMDKEPPFSTDEVIEFYTKYGFTQGVSVDHLILDFVEDKQFRFDLTLSNAQDFIKRHKKEKLKWLPIASLQGWDVQSYARAARECAKMGYEYFALGGIVKSSTEYIMRILSAIEDEFRALKKSKLKIHLFGVTRFQALPTFAKIGAYSFDSTSVYVMAWMRPEESYLTPHGKYGCIRLPVTSKLMREMDEEELAKQSINPNNLRDVSTKLVERVCRFAHSSKTKAPKRLVDDVVAVNLAAYPLEEHEIKPLRRNIKKVLLERIWKKCPCRLCQDLGPNIQILYGKDLTAARAMHNLNAFHNMIYPAIMKGESFDFLSKVTTPIVMKPLFELPPP